MAERLISLDYDIFIDKPTGGGGRRKISRDQPHARQDNNLSEKPVKKQWCPGFSSTIQKSEYNSEIDRVKCEIAFHIDGAEHDGDI
jgi:hypothetical protein